MRDTGTHTHTYIYISLYIYIYTYTEIFVFIFLLVYKVINIRYITEIYYRTNLYYYIFLIPAICSGSETGFVTSYIYYICMKIFCDYL